MKTQTNTGQAYNEVKELLDEYVVLPLNNNISKEFLKTENNLIEEIKEKTEILKNNTVCIYDDLRYLKNKLNTSFDFENEENAFEQLKDEIEELINDLSIDSKFETVTEDIKNIEGLFNKFDQKLFNELNSIKNEFENIKIAISEKSDDVQKQYEKLLSDINIEFIKIFEKINNLEVALHNNDKLCDEGINRVLEKIEQVSQTQSVNINKAGTIAQKTEEIIISNTSEKYKSLMITMVLFNIFELIGIISLFLYIFLTK